MPRIIPRRTMRLEDERVEAGKPVEVSDAAAELALRHGWADAAPVKASRKAAAAQAAEAGGADGAGGADQAAQE